MSFNRKNEADSEGLEKLPAFLKKMSNYLFMILNGFFWFLLISILNVLAPVSALASPVVF